METRRSSRLESSSSNSTIHGRTVLPSSFSSHVLCYWVGTATEDTSFCTVYGRAAIYLGDHQFLYGWTYVYNKRWASPLSPTWQMGIDQPPDMPAPVRPSKCCHACWRRVHISRVSSPECRLKKSCGLRSMLFAAVIIRHGETSGWFFFLPGWNQFGVRC